MIAQPLNGQIESEAQNATRQPDESPTSVDVRQRAGMSEGATGQEPPTGTGEKPSPVRDTGDQSNEPAPKTGQELHGGARGGARVTDTEGRAGVQRQSTGAVIPGRSGESLPETRTEAGDHGSIKRVAEQTTLTGINYFLPNYRKLRKGVG